MDIVFVRHGRTKVNEKGVYGGFIDAPLSRKGIEEAGKAAELIKGETFDRVYISPLKRAVQTAELLGYGCGAAYSCERRLDERLRELNFGIFEGLSYGEILQKYPKEAYEWSRDYINYRIPKAESFRDLYERTGAFLSELSQEEQENKPGNTSKRILIITHDGVIKSALCSVFKTPEHYFRFRVEHCRFTQIAIEDGYMYLKSLNASEII